MSQPPPREASAASSFRFNVPSFREVEERENERAAARLDQRHRQQLQTFHTQKAKIVASVSASTVPPAYPPSSAAVAQDIPPLIPAHFSRVPNGSGTGADVSGLPGTRSNAQPLAARATPPLPAAAQSYRLSAPNAIIVNSRQRGNPILASVRNVPYEYGDVVPDYVVGQTSCALFLSLKYHRLHPEYILDRVTALGNMYVLRILLCLVDIDTHHEPLRELNKLCVQAGLTLILAWSNEEAGRYLETFKSFEHKSPDAIRERVDEKEGYLGRLTAVLTSVKRVNKTDVVTLASNFGSLRRIVHTPSEELALCPGFGEQKVRRLREAFEEPFIASKKWRKTRDNQQEPGRLDDGGNAPPAGPAARAGSSTSARGKRSGRECKQGESGMAEDHVAAILDRQLDAAMISDADDKGPANGNSSRRDER